MNWNDQIESMSLQDLSAYSLNLKEEIEDPNNLYLKSKLKSKLEKVEIERKKKKLQALMIDLEYGGHKSSHLKKQIDDLKKELVELGVNTVALEPKFTRQAIYGH